jgi:hypothetical protein
MAIMKAKGYDVQHHEDKEVVSWTLGADIALMTTDKPNSLNFYTYTKGGKATLEDANGWNKEYKYSKMYLDKDNDPTLELDLDLTGGVTEDRIIDFIYTCKISYDRWYDEFGPK